MHTKIIVGLDSVECGKECSPYYELCKMKFKKIDPKKYPKLRPWHEYPVSLAFRRPYTQKSYCEIRGYWLVLQFRQNDKGRERRKWVLDRIPAERLGCNVPLPQDVIYKRYLEHYDKTFDKLGERGIQNLEFFNEAFTKLQEIKDVMPQLLKGSRIYLWEKLAWLYHGAGDLNKAESCLRIQGSFQPGSSGPFLNLGVFYSQAGQYSKAFDIYLEGLQINPKDEFIYYNLASLVSQLGNYRRALKAINDAILANPKRPFNYKLKGDIHLRLNQYHRAITSYEEAMRLLEPKMACYKREICDCLIKACERIGDLEKAKLFKEEKERG